MTPSPTRCTMPDPDSFVFKGYAMTFSLPMANTLAHTPGNILVGILLLAVVIGFIAGLFFERISNRKNQDREN
jgi:hypothetical protein